MKGAVALKRGGSGQLTSARSKTGDPACSQAMSAWVRGRKGGGVPAEIFSVLARCRAKARALGKARDHATAGNDLKAQVWHKRAERGMSGAERDRRAAELRAGRKPPAAKAAAKTAGAKKAKAPAARAPKHAPKPAGPSLREQAEAHRAAKGTKLDRLQGFSRRGGEIRARLNERLQPQSLPVGAERQKVRRHYEDRIIAIEKRGERLRPEFVRLRRERSAAESESQARERAERSARAKSLAGMRKQLNNVKADLRHYDAKWGARNDAIDDSRRDRLDELAFVRRQIAKVRGKKARR